jgi:serine/threonine protein kinase
MTGSIDSFGEGSQRRTAFVSGLAAILRIPEKQMVIISVTSGSVIVELGFLRVDGAQASPTEIASRLKTAATAGQLDAFGVTTLSVGSDKVLDKVLGEQSSSLSAGVITGAVVGSLLGALLLSLLLHHFFRRTKVHSGDVELNIIQVPSTWQLSEGFTIIDTVDLVEDKSFNPVTKGSFGVVCKCRWKSEIVAVKKLKQFDANEQFVQEATMMSIIHHPNCVRLWGACKVPYQAIVMEWMGGGDLETYILQRPLPPLHLRMSLFRQICAGLYALHSHNPHPIIHSDLKPANILLSEDKKVAKISDFGLSKIKTASYGSGGTVGTMRYNSPEMLLKGEAAHRPTDLYAMGLILWELLAGKLVWHNFDGTPFRPHQLNAAYFQKERPSLNDISAVSSIDPTIITLMQQCWAEDPSNRPDASELWQRMSALDHNNPENNAPLKLHPDGFIPYCYNLDDCLRHAMSNSPPSVIDALLGDLPIIHARYIQPQTQVVVKASGLSEVEAKCIIMFTHECLKVPNHPSPSHPGKPKRDYQVYYAYNSACRFRDSSAVERFQNFSFHFLSGLQKLPSVVFNPGAKLYRGFGQRLAEMNDLYKVQGEVCWHQTSSCTSVQRVAYEEFANESGTLMELIGVVKAKDIRLLSMIPAENEYIILHNSQFKVQVALTCDQARLLDQEHKVLPDNVDLVILEYIRAD